MLNSHKSYLNVLHHLSINLRKKKKNIICGNDLDLQLKFRNIEYVDVSSCKKLRPISETYVKEVREEHQEALKKIKIGHKKITEATLDENHFLMIDLTTNTPHVVDEEWFVDVNKSTSKEIRCIGEDTLSKCMENPNKPTALSTTDRRNISRYFKGIKISSQIIKLK